MSETKPSAPVGVGLRVQQYIQVRDKLRAMDKDYEEKKKPLVELQNLLTGWLIAFLEKSGGEAVRTEHGTVYASVRTSASLADPDAFMKFVIENDKFELLDRRANSTACRDYMTEHQTPVPGVNLTALKTVGVRKAS